MLRSRTLPLIALLSLPACLAPPPDELAVWSEFVPYAEVAGQLEILAAYDTAVFVAIAPDRLDRDWWNLVRAAAAHDVPLRPWLQLPDEGIWLNERNVAAFATFADEYRAAADAEGVTVPWLIFDLEPDFAFASALRDAFAGDDAGDPLALLGTQLDAARFAAAQVALRNLVADLHARGTRVMVATLPWTLDDQADGDTTIQDLFDTPLDDIPWDEVAVMAYRPVFADLFGLPFTAEYVGSYARTARRLFGARARVAVGNVGRAGLLVPPGYTAPEPLLADLAAARLAGVRSLSVFSLDGMLETGGAARWLRAATAPTLYAPRPDPATAVVRGLIGVADAASDLLADLLADQDRGT